MNIQFLICECNIVVITFNLVDVLILGNCDFFPHAQYSNWLLVLDALFRYCEKQYGAKFLRFRRSFSLRLNSGGNHNTVYSSLSLWTAPSFQTSGYKERKNVTFEKNQA